MTPPFGGAAAGPGSATAHTSARTLRSFIGSVMWEPSVRRIIAEAPPPQRAAVPARRVLFMNGCRGSRTGGAGCGPRGPQRKGPAGGWGERGPQGAAPGDRTRPPRAAVVHEYSELGVS